MIQRRDALIILNDLRSGQSNDLWTRMHLGPSLDRIDQILAELIEIRAPSIKQVIGDYGSGKTMLLNHLAGFYRRHGIPVLAAEMRWATRGFRLPEVVARLTESLLLEVAALGTIIEANTVQDLRLRAIIRRWNEVDVEGRHRLAAGVTLWLTSGGTTLLRNLLGEHEVPLYGQPRGNDGLALLFDLFGAFSARGQSPVILLDEVEACAKFSGGPGEFLELLRKIVDHADYLTGLYLFGTHTFVTELDRYPALRDRLYVPPSVASIKSATWYTDLLFDRDPQVIMQRVLDVYEAGLASLSDADRDSWDQSRCQLLDPVVVRALQEETYSTGVREFIRMSIALADVGVEDPLRLGTMLDAYRDLALPPVPEVQHPVVSEVQPPVTPWADEPLFTEARHTEPSASSLAFTRAGLSWVASAILAYMKGSPMREAPGHHIQVDRVEEVDDAFPDLMPPSVAGQVGRDIVDGSDIVNDADPDDPDSVSVESYPSRFEPDGRDRPDSEDQKKSASGTDPAHVEKLNILRQRIERSVAAVRRYQPMPDPLHVFRALATGIEAGAYTETDLGSGEEPAEPPSPPKPYFPEPLARPGLVLTLRGKPKPDGSHLTYPARGHTTGRSITQMRPVTLEVLSRKIAGLADLGYLIRIVPPDLSDRFTPAALAAYLGIKLTPETLESGEPSLPTGADLQTIAHGCHLLGIESFGSGESGVDDLEPLHALGDTYGADGTTEGDDDGGDNPPDSFDARGHFRASLVDHVEFQSTAMGESVCVIHLSDAYRRTLFAHDRLLMTSDIMGKENEFLENLVLPVSYQHKRLSVLRLNLILFDLIVGLTERINMNLGPAQSSTDYMERIEAYAARHGYRLVVDRSGVMVRARGRFSLFGARLRPMRLAGEGRADAGQTLPPAPA